jgi:peptide chain release factor 3
MTEKLLLYGGALQMAGAVRQKGEQRSTQSDFMEMEKSRGISISATVMTFDYNALRINILDTPGHQDFSEDTYRALAAADNAVMLLDAAKGLEPQTRKLFEVCRMRSLPLFTFVNKMDRPALSPYTIMDQIESEFGLATYPILWSIGDGDRFKGVLDRMTNIVHLFDRGDKRGGKADVQQVHMSDSTTLQQVINDDELYNKLVEDTELLNELIAPLDMNRVLAGSQSPLFFGSAMTNFGVQLFLDKFCDMGTRPSGRLAAASTNTIKIGSKSSSSEAQDEGTRKNNNNDKDESSSLIISPNHHEFSGFVFKTQANLDPRHRDRLAYIRIVSGSFHKGMKVGHSRSKPNKRYNLATAQTVFGSDRESIEVAYPGDVIGINNPGNFAIGYVLFLFISVLISCSVFVCWCMCTFAYFCTITSHSCNSLTLPIPWVMFVLCAAFAISILGTLYSRGMIKLLSLVSHPSVQRYLPTSVIRIWINISHIRRALINYWLRVPYRHYVNVMMREAGR